MTKERKDELYGRMLLWICERVQNDRELFGVLHDEFGMTQEELHDHSIESLDGFFQQDKAQAIADALIREGMENTTTGNWIYSFEEINERFGTDLPTDEKLMDAISHRLYDQSDSVADFCISEEGVDLDFYYGQCPNYCGDDEDTEEGIQPQM